MVRIRDKLAALSFLSDAAQPLTQAIDDVLGECGNLTPITGGPLVRLKAMALLLADPVRSQQVVDSSAVAKTIDGMWVPTGQTDATLSNEAQECGDDEGVDEGLVEDDASFDTLPHSGEKCQDAVITPDIEAEASEEAEADEGEGQNEEEEEAETADSGFWF